MDILSKYRQRLVNINAKLEACDKMQTYKLYGELITANLYRIKNENIKNLTLENYYDNNNPITIPLDKSITPSMNAKSISLFRSFLSVCSALSISTFTMDRSCFF